VGASIGAGEGIGEGAALGRGVGSRDGTVVGWGVGHAVGTGLGTSVGAGDGGGVGASEGRGVGGEDGSAEGTGVGEVGTKDGTEDGDRVGLGVNVGIGVGDTVGSELGVGVGGSEGPSVGRGVGWDEGAPKKRTSSTEMSPRPPLFTPTNLRRVRGWPKPLMLACNHTSVASSCCSPALIHAVVHEAPSSGEMSTDKLVTWSPRMWYQKDRPLTPPVPALTLSVSSWIPSGSVPAPAASFPDASMYM